MTAIIMYMFRKINGVAHFENFNIDYRFRNCPPILKLRLIFEIALRNFEITQLQYTCALSKLA